MSETEVPERDDMPRDGERVFYIRDAAGQPIACLAWCCHDDKVNYAASFLHPNDAFDRRRARQIALGRLRGRPDWATLGLESTPLTTALLTLARRPGAPSRARRALTDSIRRRGLEV
jgi:hypothetical protein